jgi:NADH dehydrogenase (ubiquinone) 1 alpha subcomplex subunit 9
MRYSNIVVNLIGKQYETRNFKFKDVNVDGARRIARIAREEGVERLIHISAINAREKPDVSSAYMFIPTLDLTVI